MTSMDDAKEAARTRCVAEPMSQSKLCGRRAVFPLAAMDSQLVDFMAFDVEISAAH